MNIRTRWINGRKYCHCDNYTNYYDALKQAKYCKHKYHSRYQIYPKTNKLGKYYELWTTKHMKAW